MVLNLMTQYIRKWIERKDHKKHKIDFYILVEWWQFGALIAWAIVIPAALHVVAGESFIGGMHVVIWSFLAAMEWMGIQRTKHMLKPLHDWLWAMRENQTVYEMEKAHCEQRFVESRRDRMKWNAILFGITFAFFGLFVAVADYADPNWFVWQYLIVNALVNIANRYIFFVFDFDPPKKKKKASQSISELVQRLWGEFIGGFSPQPAPAFAQHTI